MSRHFLPNPWPLFVHSLIDIWPKKLLDKVNNVTFFIPSSTLTTKLLCWYENVQMSNTGMKWKVHHLKGSKHFFQWNGKAHDRPCPGICHNKAPLLSSRFLALKGPTNLCIKYPIHRPLNHTVCFGHFILTPVTHKAWKRWSDSDCVYSGLTIFCLGCGQDHNFLLCTIIYTNYIGFLRSWNKVTWKEVQVQRRYNECQSVCWGLQLSNCGWNRWEIWWVWFYFFCSSLLVFSNSVLQ